MSNLIVILLSFCNSKLPFMSLSKRTRKPDYFSFTKTKYIYFRFTSKNSDLSKQNYALLITSICVSLGNHSDLLNIIIRGKGEYFVLLFIIRNYVSLSIL